MKTRRLWCGISVVILAGTGILAGCGGPDPPMANGMQTPHAEAVADVIVRAEELTRAFGADKEAARQRFRGGDKLTIKGIVEQVIRIDGMSIVHIILNGHVSSDGGIQCTLADPADAGSIEAGDGVTIEGVFGGEVFGKLMVYNCRVVE